MIDGLLIAEACRSDSYLLCRRRLRSRDALTLPLVLLACLDQADEPLELALYCGGGRLCVSSSSRSVARKALRRSAWLPSTALFHWLLQVGACLAVDCALLTLRFAQARLLLASSDIVFWLDEVVHLLVLLLSLQQELRRFGSCLDLHVIRGIVWAFCSSHLIST